VTQQAAIGGEAAAVRASDDALPGLLQLATSCYSKALEGVREERGQATTEYAVLTFVVVFAVSFLTVWLTLEEFVGVFEYVNEVICLPFP
jgi:hypothetical protein